MGQAVRLFNATRRRFIFRATGGDVPTGSFIKDPAEQYPVGITMQGQLPSGRVVSRATVSSLDLGDSTDVTSATLVRTNAAKTSDYVIEVDVKAGTAAHRYKLTFTIFDDANHKYVETLIMIVRPS